MKEKIFYYGSIGILALFVTVYLIVRVTSSNTLERDSGMEYDYKSSENKADIREVYQIRTKQGNMRLKVFKNRRYEMYWYVDTVALLYSKGAWTCEFYEPVGRTRYDEDRFVYALNSDKIEPQYAQYRMQRQKLVGNFKDPANPKRILNKDNVIDAPISESFRFLIFDDFIMNVDTKQKYQLLKKWKDGIQYYDYRKTNVLDRPVSPEQDSAGMVAIEFKKSSRIASVYTCDTCLEAHKVRFVLYKNRTYEVHLIHNKETLLYSKGYYKPGKGMTLQSEELEKEAARYRFEHYPIQGEFHCGFEQLTTLEAIDSSTCFVEIFRVYGKGPNLKKGEQLYQYDSDLSTMNIVRSNDYYY